MTSRKAGRSARLSLAPAYAAAAQRARLFFKPPLTRRALSPAAPALVSTDSFRAAIRARVRIPR